LVSETVEVFKERLKERGVLDISNSVVNLLQLIEYPIQELTSYFADSTHSRIDAKGAYIFSFFIKKHVEELKAIAKEIDETYESEP
jgi:hypothetical protein